MTEGEKKRLLVSSFKFLPVFDSSAREGVIVCLVVRAALGGEGDDDVWPIYMQMLLSIVYCYGRIRPICCPVQDSLHINIGLKQSGIYMPLASLVHISTLHFDMLTLDSQGSDDASRCARDSMRQGLSVIMCWRRRY